MDAGEWLTRWTVRLAVGCYAIRLLLDVAVPVTLSRLRIGRALWTAGCVLYLLHVALAFHVFHHWSHADAYRFTAEQTARTVGWNWGGGLYFNYLFTLLWCGDVAAWWRLGAEYPQRFRQTFWMVQAVFAFMVFNATVVFGPVGWRWAAVGMLLVGAWAYWRRALP